VRYPADVLVFMDHERHLYLLPRETLERARVPEEQRAAIEAALHDDVHGYYAGGADPNQPGLGIMLAALGVITVPVPASAGRRDRAARRRSRRADGPALGPPHSAG
jgi:hypothetical protein